MAGDEFVPGFLVGKSSLGTGCGSDVERPGCGGAVSGDVAGFVSSVCNAVPAGINTSLAFAENAADIVWTALQSIERVRFLVDDVIEGAVGAIQSGVNGVRNVVDGIDDVVDDIKDLANDILDFVDVL